MRLSRLTWLAVAAVVPIAVLFVVPGTRWVVRAYFARLSGPSPVMIELLADLGVRELPGGGSVPSPRPSNALALADAAKRHPTDIGAQIVLASCDEAGGKRLSGWDVVPALRKLAARFPTRSEIWADALRHASTRLSLGRDMEESYPAKPPTPGSAEWFAPPAWSRTDLESFEAMAANGEKAEPANGYFPYMRSIALFGLKRDEDALAAIHRAAECSRWDDYATFATGSELQLRRQTFGRQGAYYGWALDYSTLFPHYAQMRAGARVALYDAAQAEQHGDPAKGLAIRRDLIAFASQMRADSRTTIGAFVAVALTSMAARWPRGIVPADVKALPAEEATARRESAFLGFVAATAGPTERQWAAGRIEAAREAKEILSDAVPKSGMLGPDALTLAGHWSAGMALLAISLWCVAMGVVGVQFRPGRRTTWEAPAIVLAGLIGLGWLSWAAWASTRLAYAVIDVALRLTSGGGGPAPPSAAGMWMLAPLLVPAMAILVAGVSALVGALSRTGALRGMGIGLLWTGVAFSLFFAWIVVATVHQEDLADVAVQRSLQNEPHYMADLVGRKWPGP